MKNILEYNGYTGVVEFSAEDMVFFGKIFGINDLVTFEGETVRDLERAFRDAVDDYIKTCSSEGKEPERAYKGSFNVRINPDIHRMAAARAQSMHISLNELVERAITREVQSATGAIAEPEARYQVIKPRRGPKSDKSVPADGSRMRKSHAEKIKRKK